MPILSGDIKLNKSQVMLDVPEGGGAPTGNVIVDAVSNAIFPDVSELDRALGRVNLRKVFVAIDTDNTDQYFGANVIVAEPPKDPLVSVTLFSTAQTFDRRSAARSRIEAYLAQGPAYAGYLFGNHISGMAQITLLQRAELPLPVVGDTIMLRAFEGAGNQVEQYVRVTNVASLLRNFSDASGDFQRMQVTCGISDTLRNDFPGFDPLRYDAVINYTGKTRLYATIVADAARYYGVVKLDEAASIGDFGVKAAGIFTQIVPSTRIEVPIADARLNQQSATLVEAGDAYSRTLTLAFTSAQALYVGGSILPGTLTVSRGGVTISDKGGGLVDASGSVIGGVDYANGVLTLASNVFGAVSGAHVVGYKPALRPIIVTDSFAEPVTQQGQRLSYVYTFNLVPARGTLQVSYRVQGRWYVLMDNGAGEVRGADSSFGAGMLNYASGTLSVTLGALPDVGSAIVFTFASASVSIPIQKLRQAGPSLPRAFGKVVSVGQAIEPGSIALSWNDGAARTAGDLGGALTGAASGTVNYATGEIWFRPTTLPAAGTAISLALNKVVKLAGSVLSMTDGGAAWQFTLGAAVKPSSVELALVATYDRDNYGPEPGRKTTSIRLFDDGAGNLLTPNVSGNLQVGTVNYATGDCSVQKETNGYVLADYYRSMPFVSGYAGNGLGGGFQAVYETLSLPPERKLTVVNGLGLTPTQGVPWSWWAGGVQTNGVEYRCASGANTADTFPFTLDQVFLPNNPNAYTNPSGQSARLVSFQLGADFYVKQDATWTRNPSPVSGTGTAAGSDSVVGGVAGVLLTSWSAGTSSAPSGVAGATVPDASGGSTPMAVMQACFRTAISPLLTSAFQVAGNWQVSGAGFTATANSAGVVKSGGAPADADSFGALGVFGRVDYEMGICTLVFGRQAGANKHAADDVLDITDLAVPGVTHVQMAFVQADTLRYNAVGYSYLPLDAELLGLDPVRLPADGRVPIFRAGSICVLGHTHTSAPRNVVNGDSYDAGRVRLSRVRVIGANGQVINTGYTADLEAGTVDFTNVAGYSQPVKIEDRIEDMMLCSGAQISGHLTFTRPVTHAYPADDSYVSSALVAGDLNARVSLTFDQASWNGQFSDTLVGNAATAKYNSALAPIVVTNAGAITERWVIRFTGTTAFEVIGEHVGVIATGNTSTATAPLNPASGAPYFTIAAIGWGAGWAVGNVLRINTVGAEFPVWVARTVRQGPETVIDDAFTLLIRGDVDRP